MVSETLLILSTLGKTMAIEACSLYGISINESKQKGISMFL